MLSIVIVFLFKEISFFSSSFFFRHALNRLRKIRQHYKTCEITIKSTACADRFKRKTPKTVDRCSLLDLL